MTLASMPGFRRNAQGQALLGETVLSDLLLRPDVTTPAYVYDLDGIHDTARQIELAFGNQPHLVAYAVKANSAGSVLRTLARGGLGADVVSGGELELALGAGVPADRIVMSGVAKTDAELDYAISVGIAALQAESSEEIARITTRARSLGRLARVALRINPGVEIDSHSHIATGHDAAKFGVPAAEVPAALALIDAEPDALVAVGLSTHVGSMMAAPDPYRKAARLVCELARARLASGQSLEYVDFGGGIGVDYGTQPCAPPADFVRAALATLHEAGLGHLRLLMEPGRALVAPFGVLLSRVVQRKVTGTRRWLLLDAGMNDLLRPALYAARHRIEPLASPPGEREWRVVGPVCESSDDFGSHPLGDEVPEHVAIRDAGAYGFVMASEYNGRALPSEVFLSGGQVVSVSASPGRSAWIARRLSA